MRVTLHKLEKGGKEGSKIKVSRKGSGKKRRVVDEKRKGKGQNKKKTKKNGLEGRKRRHAPALAKGRSDS